eukprot:gnl/Dysnectes_brevis/5265_a7497_514.p1 GENE.gnl/Dysnectes_brevis/5265_a7497_514~~gnl/Dysnectes_brevis/5265_a7497_514.p1  ORF type:complete len:412 (-),score=141.84 gnl/Dysnectes_brevis/5265_a7497_514:27-1262(-)
MEKPTLQEPSFDKAAALQFKVDGTYKHARATTVTLPHGPIPTPIYMPVGTQGTLKGITTAEIEALNPPIMLSNTYFLNLRPGIETLEAVGGLHKLMDRKGNILTDSGGFQFVSLLDLSEVTEQGVEFISPVTGSHLLLTPEESIRTQQAIGSDVMMALDDVISATLTDRARIEEASLRTTRWLDRCINTHTNPHQVLFGIIQGHLDYSKDGLRDQCLADIIARYPYLGGVAIGGLSGGEAKDDFWRVVHHCCRGLPPGKPRYLMGVGVPLDLVVCACLGVDMFDCVFATRTGRFGTALVPEGSLSLHRASCKQDPAPIQAGCACPACRHSRSYLFALFKEKSPVAGQLVSQHNVWYLLQLMRGIREAILTSRLDGYVQDFLCRRYASLTEVPTWARDALNAAEIVLSEWKE